MQLTFNQTPTEKCSDPEFFWSIFYRLQTEYGDLQSKAPYSARMRKKEIRKTLASDTFHALKY